MSAKPFWGKLHIHAAGLYYKFMSSNLIRSLKDFSSPLPNSYSEPHHFPQRVYQLSASIALSRWPNLLPHWENRSYKKTQHLLLSWPPVSFPSCLLSLFTAISGKKEVFIECWSTVCQTLFWLSVCPHTVLASWRSQTYKQTRSKQWDLCYNRCKNRYWPTLARARTAFHQRLHLSWKLKKKLK